MVETYESGHTSMNTLLSFLRKIFKSDEEYTVVGETPGGDCWIHIKKPPAKADETLEKSRIFKANRFEDLPNVQGVERNSQEGYVRLDVKS